MPEVVLTGAAGRIEGRYSPGKSDDRADRADPAPAPQGGRPDEPPGGGAALPPVHEARLLATLRFNFRGVGRSQGEFDSGIGELADAATALDWLQSTNPAASQCWVAGYSFGAWIGMQLLMRRPETDGFISVSPPTNMYDFSFLAPCPASGLILHGAADTVVPPVEVERVVSKLRTQKGIVIDYEVVDKRHPLLGREPARRGKARRDLSRQADRRRPDQAEGPPRREEGKAARFPSGNPARPGPGRRLPWPRRR